MGRQQEIEDAGHDPKVLMRHGILLDTDLRENGEDMSTCSKRYGRRLRSQYLRFTLKIHIFLLMLRCNDLKISKKKTVHIGNINTNYLTLNFMKKGCFDLKMTFFTQ